MAHTNASLGHNNNNQGPNKNYNTTDSAENRAAKDDAEMRSFLVQKSTAQQLREGVERPVDTAYVESDVGGLMLKAVFDVQHFKPDEITIKIIDKQLSVVAQGLDDREAALYRKTMIRKIDLPENVDPTEMRWEVSAEGRLTVSMPFHMEVREKPNDPAAVPIITVNGKRVIRLQFMIGPDFTMDDVKVDAEGSNLMVTASYEAELGVQGAQVTQRQFRKEFRLPDHIEVDEVNYALSREGVLMIEILLKDIGEGYKCSITTEELS